MKNDRTCVIGGGPAGLTAVKALRDHGVEVVAYDCRGGVGGVWRARGEQHLPGVYSSLRTNTSAPKSGFADYPMPADFPDYPRHDQVLSYFEEYAREFGLERCYRFRHSVVQVARIDDGYRVSVRTPDGDVRHENFGQVVVASGSYTTPRWPEFTGELQGRVIHAAHYRSNELARGKRVVVMGIGSSAADIAVDTSKVAERVFLSTRRSGYILPRYLFGRTLDSYYSPRSNRIPSWLAARLLRGMLWVSVGSQQSYGLPKPPYEIGHRRPALNDEILGLIRDGSIEVRPGIERLDGERVQFTEGPAEEVDLVVCATGYETEFPFLPEEFRRDMPALRRAYLHTTPEGPEGLHFVGFVEVFGATFPIYEAQAKLVAEVIAGRLRLPPVERRRDVMEQWGLANAAKFGRDVNKLPLVDYYFYLELIARERRRCLLGDGAAGRLTSKISQLAAKVRASAEPRP